MSYNFGWRGPNIVKDGLVLYLDSVSPNSYSNRINLNTWKDISGNSNNGTKTSTTNPIYNNTHFSFNGSNSVVNCGNSSSLQITTGSVSIWFRTSSPGSSYRGIITKRESWGLFTLNGELLAFDWGNGAPRLTGLNIADGQWRNIVLTFTETIGTPLNNAIIYVNKVPILTTTVKNASQIYSCLVGHGNFTGQFINGDVSNVQIYNKVLNQTEINKNYDALKSRFGL
jgi:hypothetical protein